jgi:glycosyltransferase involved in cell wall biosynthesis
MGNLAFAPGPCPQAISIQNPYLFYDVRNTGRMSFVDKLWLFFLKRRFVRQLPWINMVFCQTDTMRKRMRSIYGYDGPAEVTSKVVSAFSSSVSSDGFLPAPIAGLKEKFKLFYLARYYPHKGHELLLETFERYGDELSDTVVVISIAAEQHPNAARLLDGLKDLGLEERIVNVGPLKQEELAGYYSACDCLVMPTRLESFSGTYLEAMHFGLPILTSGLDFAEEICGDAAVYFDPWSPEDLKNSILKVKNDPVLRKDLVEKGRARLAGAFGRTWSEIAEEIQKGLRSLASS